MAERESKGPVRKTFETAAKVWTVISIPIEAYLLAHGLIGGNLLEAGLGAGGLAGDLFIWKWFRRKDRQNNLQNPAALKLPKGSERFVYA